MDMTPEEFKALSKKRSKYRSQRVTVGERTYDSKKEATCAAQLQALEAAGKIHNLRYQVRYDLIVNGLKVTSYRADFTWEDEAGKEIVADAKGFRTREYKIKRNLMIALFGISIVEL